MLLPQAVDSRFLLRATSGRLGHPYLSAGVFHCPADKSYAVVSGTRSPRVRSYVMNWFMGTDRFYQGFPDKIGRVEYDYLTLDQVGQRSPSNLFVFIDEQEDSIGDSRFDVISCRYPAIDWESFPASRHGKAANLSFADGHVESHRWKEASTLVPVQRKHLYPFLVPKISRDILWLREHATEPVAK